MQARPAAVMRTGDQVRRRVTTTATTATPTTSTTSTPTTTAISATIPDEDDEDAAAEAPGVTTDPHDGPFADPADAAAPAAGA